MRLLEFTVIMLGGLTEPAREDYSDSHYTLVIREKDFSRVRRNQRQQT